MRYISLEELKQTKGVWAVWVDSEELFEELRKHFTLCSKYYGSGRYSNYGTHASGYDTLERAVEYWERNRDKQVFVIKDQFNPEIY